MLIHCGTFSIDFSLSHEDHRVFGGWGLLGHSVLYEETKFGAIEAVPTVTWQSQEPDFHLDSTWPSMNSAPHCGFLSGIVVMTSFQNALGFVV